MVFQLGHTIKPLAVIGPMHQPSCALILYASGIAIKQSANWMIVCMHYISLSGLFVLHNNNSISVISW